MDGSIKLTIPKLITAMFGHENSFALREKIKAIRKRRVPAITSNTNTVETSVTAVGMAGSPCKGSILSKVGIKRQFAHVLPSCVSRLPVRWFPCHRQRVRNDGRSRAPAHG